MRSNAISHWAIRLGFGIHGTVFAAADNTKAGFFAVKFHREKGPFEHECRAHERLRTDYITQILGLNVPQLLMIDKEFRTIEMTIVRKPFLLDFADALLDQSPDFSEDVFRDVMRVLEALRGFGIHLHDINPGNIRFAEEA